MSTATRIDAWIWVVVYGGLIVLGVGLTMQRSDDAFGWVIAMFGALLIAVGALLVWIRSRIKTDRPPTEKRTP
jgi:membrane protein DedA with SNARE-associated domain